MGIFEPKSYTLSVKIRINLKEPPMARTADGWRSCVGISYPLRWSNVEAAVLIAIHQTDLDRLTFEELTLVSG